MPLREETLTDTGALMQRVLEIARELPQGRFLWYRGLPCSTYGLVPRLLRTATSSAAALDRERRLAVRFRQRSLPYWPNGYPQDDWEHLFVMQHHGVPTRLLDWSENLFLGLYFALPAAPAHNGDRIDHECQPTLWCLDPVGWNKGLPHLQGMIDQVSIPTTADTELIRAYRPANEADRLFPRYDHPIAMYGSHNSARIVAQRGTFTIAGTGLDPLDVYASNLLGDATLWKLRLEVSEDELRADLTRLGFTESMIFPDLAALGRELSQAEV